MRAENKILYLIENSGEKGILQSDIPKILHLSKSTVSDILSELERTGEIIREKVSSKSYRVWYVHYYPSPIPGILRIGILKSTEYFHVIVSALRCNAILRLFDDPIDLTRAVSQGRVDIALSPLLTQTMMGLLMKSYRIIRIVAKNGSGIVYGDGDGIYGTTEISTMDRNLRKYLSKMGKKSYRIVYFSSPEAIVESLKKGNIRGIAIWEPFLSILKAQGYSVSYFNDIIGDFLCCSMSVNNESLRINGEFIKEFLEEYDNCCKERITEDKIDVVGDVLGFDRNIIEDSIKNYKFCIEPDMDEVVDYLRDSGFEVNLENLERIFDLTAFRD